MYKRIQCLLVKALLILALPAALCLITRDVSAEDVSASTSEGNPVVEFVKQLNIYGYFSVRFEKSYSVPTVADDVIVRSNDPAEWSQPFFHLMIQSELGDDFKIFVNLNGDGGGAIDIRNLWGEYAPKDYLHLRAGKIYRTFGLYNEILDAVPTYIGIEPPELFDKDHLILSRTTNFMVSGRIPMGNGNFNYSLTNDNGEGDPFSNAFPIGYDLNYKFHQDDYTIGISGYGSNGPATSCVALGDGSPSCGVLPWMSEDDFDVFGGYGEARVGPVLLQTEYWKSNHNALRDPASVVTLVNEAGLNQNQIDRFLIDPSAPATEDNVNVIGDYEVKTWYIRAGYFIELKKGELIPYFQWDWYSNPEEIENKDFGGDAEAGASDDGTFNKSTIGIVYRPISSVALKVDQSFHMFKLNGENVSYPEVRFDISYVFGQ